ncbi:hypothetical protein HMI54_006405 [Coelomomyces lativittatus]|nr:hypothetical protein HMI56_005639 [Coelomomyces lativittatus]KAJ1517243.1 hypothetical protein HMI54_006405 [Coelomomyces lativittatus]
MLRYFFRNDTSAFATFVKVMATSTLGIYLGSTLAIHGSKYLDTAGLFHYVPEEDESDLENANDSQKEREKNAEKKDIQTSSSSQTTTFLLDEHLLSNWAFESTGDLTLNTTINLHHWDQDARAFQLLQYRLFLMNLEKQTPTKTQKDEYREWNRLRSYVKESIDDVESRLNK